MNYILFIFLGLFLFTVILVFLLRKKKILKEFGREEVSKIIERFIDGTSSEYEWDDFISTSISDIELEKIRSHCANLRDEFPPTEKEKYCNEEGIKVLKGYISELRNKPGKSEGG